MKKGIILFIVLLLGGCSYGTEQLKTLLEDPHYMEYRDNRDKLEKSYLDGDITYAQYLDSKKQLDDDYDREVREREEKLHE